MGTKRPAAERVASEVGVYDGVTDEQVQKFMNRTGETDVVQARLQLTRIMQRNSNYEINKRAKPQRVHIHNEGRRK